MEGEALQGPREVFQVQKDTLFCRSEASSGFRMAALTSPVVDIKGEGPVVLSSGWEAGLACFPAMLLPQLLSHLQGGLPAIGPPLRCWTRTPQRLSVPG